MKYSEPLYRPPSEGDSLIFQIAYGCPHNTCTFCPMYKGVKYKERQLKNIIKDIKEMAVKFPDTKRVFLADGDVLHLSFAKLEIIFKHLNAEFKKLARISMYANGSSVLSKTEEQLLWLKNNKLFTLYLGLESGDSTVLDNVKKKDTPSSMIRAVHLAQKCGIRMSVMVLIGLGGELFSENHAVKTAEIVNKMSPKFLAALRFVNPPGNRMYDDYRPVSEYGAVKELLMFVEKLEVTNTVFRANHASNPIPLSARFPKDKAKLLGELKFMLKNGDLSRNGTGYIPGRL
jgi:radical SAM superfamily enzyme YgiQ (UPF0313 family)